MPNARTANAVRLEFAPDSLIQSSLSGAAFTLICLDSHDCLPRA